MRLVPQRSLLTNRRGSMALFAAGLMLATIIIAGGVVDYMSLIMQKHDVQEAADAAALGAAGEILIAQNDDDRLTAAATTMAEANLDAYHDIKVEAAPLVNATGVEVTITVPPRTFFPGIIGMTAGPVSATAVAEVSGSTICMIGLDTKVKHTLEMQKKAAITATGCAIYSNSKSPEGITVADQAVVNANFICSAGGVKLDKKMALDPAPLIDCPPISDPLASRPPPAVGGCDFKKLRVDKGVTTSLSPGVYCGGIEIKGEVSLDPGVYVIKNGSLKVKEGGTLSGEHVGFFLTGKDALINFEKESVIRLSGPRTGPLAGLLFYEDRNVVPADATTAVVIDYDTKMPAPKEHRIRSDDARELVGTIYIPRNKLLIDGDQPIAAELAYTVIIAREFALAEGPEIVLNADYGATDVPVPDGVGNKSRKTARLVR